MNCYLCDYDMGTLEKDWLYCANHQKPVLHKYGALTKTLMRVIFYVQIDDREYQVILKPMEDRSEINIITRFPSPAGGTFEMTTLIRAFEYVIHISPESAPHKIKTIITFS